jgi:hypothetical protein
MTNIDTRNLDALAGAVYFTVGRGTEGGSASYRLSVAGVDRSEWGQPGAVAANSGYSIGTISGGPRSARDVAIERDHEPRASVVLRN